MALDRLQATATSRYRAFSARRSALTIVGVGFAVALTIAVVTAAVVERHNAAASSKTAPTAQAAIETVRTYVGAATVLRDGQTACGYLTAAQAHAVAARLGGSQNCRTGVNGTTARAGGLPDTTNGVGALAITATIHGDTADVVLGQEPSFTIRLRKTTRAESDASFSPASAWRIATGAASVFRR